MKPDKKKPDKFLCQIIKITKEDIAFDKKCKKYEGLIGEFNLFNVKYNGYGGWYYGIFTPLKIFKEATYEKHFGIRFGFTAKIKKLK